jgi:biotin-(acetyl-CoA carboxylase) ligase
MRCSNCGTGCPSKELTGQFCADTVYDLNDRVKVRTKSGVVTWGTVRGLDSTDYMVMCDDTEELEWFSRNEVSHLMNYEVEV